MSAIICMLLPPLLMIAIQSKLRKEALNWDINLLVKYLITTLILNTVVMTITYVIFGHSEGFISLLNESMGFAIRYIALASLLATLYPLVTTMVNFQLEYKRPSFKIHTIAIILFYLITILFMLIEFTRCFDNAFWGDEGYTIRLAKLSTGDMIRETAADVHPPLYYFFVKGLYFLMGNNGMTYHLSAWIPYCLILVLACTVIRKEFGVITAGILVLFSSLTNEAVTHNAEVRMYPLAAFFVLAAYVELYCILKRGKRIHWILFALCSLGAAYTHYYALVTVAFFYLALLIITFLKRRMIRPMLLTVLLTIVGYFPWFSILITTFKRTVDSWWAMSIPGLKITLQCAFDYSWLLCIFFLIVIVYVLYQLQILNIRCDNKKMNGIKDIFQINVNLGSGVSFSYELIWVLSGVIAFIGTAVVGIVVSNIIRPLFLIRYLYPAAVMAYMVMGYCLSKLNFRRVWATFVCIAILFMNMSVLIGTCRSERELNTATTEFLQSVSLEEDARICTNVKDIDWTLADYYYPGIAHSYYEDEMTAVANGNNIWLIWGDELLENTLNEMNQGGLEVKKVFEGCFPNSIYCYVYQVLGSGSRE